MANYQSTSRRHSIASRIQDAHDLNRKFHKACSQLILINNLMDDMDERYNRAYASGRKSYRYILRLRLCILEGVRSAFYDYATQKADELEELQRALYLQTGINWSSQMEEQLNGLDDPELINGPEIDTEQFPVSDLPDVHSIESESDAYSDTSCDSESDMDFEDDVDTADHFHQ